MAPCRPVQAHSPTANRPGTRRARVEVGDDSAHPVVSGRCDRDQLAASGRSPPLRSSRRRSGTARGRSGACRGRRRPVGAPSAPVRRPFDGGRDLVARRQLVDEALAAVVDQRGAVAADRLGDQEALVARRREQRGRVELQELEVGELGAGGVGHRQPAADRGRRIGRTRPQRGAAAGRENHCARRRACGPRSSPMRTRTPTQRPSSIASALAEACSTTVINGCSAACAESSRVMRRPVALPPACTTRCRLWPPSSPRASSPAASRSNSTPSVDQVAHGGRRVLRPARAPR